MIKPFIFILSQDVPATWEKMIYLQTIASLGIDSTIPFINEYILGKAEAGITLSFRIVAIHSLSSNFPERHQREKVNTYRNYAINY